MLAASVRIRSENIAESAWYKYGNLMVSEPRKTGRRAFLPINKIAIKAIPEGIQTADKCPGGKLTKEIPKKPRAM